MTGNLERVLVDSWVVETASGSQSTEVYTDAKFTLLVRETVKDDAGSKVTAVPFANGEELRRLITALQSAQAYTVGKRAIGSTVAKSDE